MMETKHLTKITSQEEYERVIDALKVLYGSPLEEHRKEFTRLFRLTEEYERPMMRQALDNMLQQNNEAQ